MAQSAIDFSAGAGVVSDYRDRGLSQSDRGPALQAGLELGAGPLFVGTWASTLGGDGGADTEVDLYAGLQGALGDTAVRGGLYAYVYPGGEGLNYTEAIIEAERAFGSLTLGFVAALAPRQANVDQANRYVALSSTIDVGGGWAMFASSGYEHGFYEHKRDWEIGGSYTRGPLTATLAYVDSNYGAPDEAGRLGQGGLVAALLAEF